jgi:hypothetical protein
MNQHKKEKRKKRFNLYIIGADSWSGFIDPARKIKTQSGV